MVSSPMYDRLMEFANSAPDNEKLYGWDDEHSAIVKAIRQARDKVEHFKEYQGFTGQAGQAMSDEAARAIRRFDSQANFYMTGMSYYVEARRAIMLAAEDARQLSPTLLDPMTESLRHAGEVTIPIASKFGLPGKFVNSLVADGLAYVEGVEAQANVQREAKATEIIERFESTMNDLNTRLQSHSEAGVDTSGTADTSWTPIPELPADTADALRKGHIVISPHEGGAYGRSRSDAFGNAGLRGTDSGLYPAGYDEGGDIDQRIMRSPRVPNRYLPEGDLGSRTNPITDPQDLMDMDLLHTRVNGDRHANGVIGGHTPAPPVDRDHPLWGLNTARAAEAQSAGRLGGAGLLGAGALGLRGAARMGGSALGGLGRTGVLGAGVTGRMGAAAGASTLRAGSFSGTGMGTYTPPGSATGAGSAARGTASPTGQQSGFMGGSGAGAGGGAKDEKKRRRRRYEAFRVEDEEDEGMPRGYVNPLSQTYGSDRTMTPAKRKDDGWDISQW